MLNTNRWLVISDSLSDKVAAAGKLSCLCFSEQVVERHLLCDLSDRTLQSECFAQTITKHLKVLERAGLITRKLKPLLNPNHFSTSDIDAAYAAVESGSLGQQEDQQMARLIEERREE